MPSRFNDFFRPWNEWFDNRSSLFDGESRLLNVPSANIAEDKESYQLSLAAPGLQKKDFNVELDGDILALYICRHLWFAGLFLNRFFAIQVCISRRNSHPQTSRYWFYRRS